MDVSIIIINYKSAPLIMDCVDSIYKQTTQNSFEIIIVDNNSNDDCEEKILSLYPATTWLQTGYNAGFARANNAGINIAKGQFILLLNADTIILDGAIDKSIELLKKEKDAVGCGVQLLNTDGTDQISGAYFVKGGLNSLLPLPYLGALIRWVGYKLKSTVPSLKSFQDKIEIDWIVGAYILIKKAVLDTSGLMDEDFFIYSEEIEWCARLKKSGKLFLFAAPKVIHLLGGSSNSYYNTSERENSKNIWDKKGLQIIVSNMLRIRKQYGILWFLIITGIYLFEIPIFFFCFLIESIFKFGKASYHWKNLTGYTKNIGILLRYFFKMLANKPYFYKVD